MPVTKREIHCTVEATLTVIGGRWKVLILWYLYKGTMRFGELRKALPVELTQQMLTQQLRELEADGVVQRKVFAEVPPKVEYSLTEFGKSLQPILHEMSNWGRKYLRSKNSQADLLETK